MNETLTIKNFGPIKYIELNLKKFNVLIGEQATGKSTVAKLLAVCRYFSYIANDQRANTHPVDDRFVQGLIAWGLDEALKPDSYIQYKNKHYTLTATYQKSNIIDHDEKGNEIKYEEDYFLPLLNGFSFEFDNLLKELNKIKPKSDRGIYGYSDFFWSIPTSFLQNEVAAVMDNPFYLPTERGLQSIFSLGKNSIPNINDSLFNQFARLDQIARIFSKETEIEPLGITYKNETGRGYVKKTGQTAYYSLAKGASGYQSAIPVALTIKYYNDIKKKPKTFLIEEPELNLFPTAQKELVNYLVENAVNFGHTILLTTHSPYILTSLNNLMYASQVGKSHSKETKKVVPEKYWMNPDDVSAYLMLPNGECESIMDNEGLIKAEKIDSISAILNKDFNAIMDIELNIKE